MVVIESKDFHHLFRALQGRGYTLIGPTVRDRAIVYDVLTSVDDLPRGWTDEHSPSRYELVRRSDDALFGYVVGPTSWKKFLFPPKVQLFAAMRSGRGFEVSVEGTAEPSKFAFIGVRSCELHAIAIQDRVFAGGDYADPTYKARREQAFIVAVNCVEARGTCFCVSMNTGPKATSGYDLALTEVLADGTHCFVVDAGSSRGKEILAEVPHRDATTTDLQRAEAAEGEAVGGMGRVMDTENIKQLLYDNHEHPEWDAVSKRCLTCTNCTLVCPTCFCSTVEDATDLTGTRAERWRRWDSCFTMEFSKVAGGNTRPSTKSRYRQWMMHKLAYWLDQFGTSGCVGCGRCITWCPVGIDITMEVHTIRTSASSTTTAAPQVNA